MMCPTCGSAHHRVVETRQAQHDTTRRVRECALGHRFVTREVHEPVWCSAKRRASAFVGTIKARAELRQRDIEIARSLHAGWRPLAARLGLDKATIYLAARRGRQYIKEATR